MGIADAIKTYFKDNNAEILIGVGITAGISATGLAIYSTPEALTRIDEHKKKTKKVKLNKMGDLQGSWQMLYSNDGSYCLSQSLHL